MEKTDKNCTLASCSCYNTALVWQWFPVGRDKVCPLRFFMDKGFYSTHSIQSIPVLTELKSVFCLQRTDSMVLIFYFFISHSPCPPDSVALRCWHFICGILNSFLPCWTWKQEKSFWSFYPQLWHKSAFNIYQMRYYNSFNTKQINFDYFLRLYWIIINT